ncbi:MAG: hypothetical protein HQL33_05035 [Alphaproteobacteria bacterium]|nr:hypothetical protein [Alphaproteobacteria bacterium]MBF0129333.1 hypothetical protein [Alphaproteobacteria bacterium]
MSALGSSWPVFLGFTVVVAGWIAFMTGQAVAQVWKPAWQVIPYAILLGAADRFFVFALFGGNPLSLPGFAVDSAVLLAIGLTAHRLTLARGMTRQYPWLYERSGPFSWREKGRERTF